MSTAEALLRITMRAAGRLLARGAITRELAALLIRDAWARASFELLPSESTGCAREVDSMRVATNNDCWCSRCQTHRSSHPGGLCPSCMDDDRLGVVA